MGHSSRTFIELDDDLLRAAEELARQRGTTLDRLIAETLQQSVATARKKRHRIVIPTDGSGGLMPGVDINDNAAMRGLLDAADCS